MTKTEGYKVLSHTFLGKKEHLGKVYGYTYEITFNKSLVHTGRMQGIERGLDVYAKQEIKEELMSTPIRIWHLLIQLLKSK